MTSAEQQQPNIQTRAGQEQLRRLGVKPLPQPDALTQPYWDAARNHELRIQCCLDCQEYRHPPAERCGACGSARTEWALLSGRGTIYSFIIDHRLMVPGFAEPYVVAQVNPVETTNELVRLTANIRDCATADVYIGMAVQVLFEEVNAELSLPQFRPLIPASA